MQDNIIIVVVKSLAFKLRDLSGQDNEFFYQDQVYHVIIDNVNSAQAAHIGDDKIKRKIG